MFNPYELFIEKLIEEKIPLDMDRLSKHPKITVKFVEKHFDLDWDMFYISKKPDLTDDFVRNHKWNWRESLATNSSISSEFIIEICHRFHPYIETDIRDSLARRCSLDFIENNSFLDFSQCVSEVAENPNLTPEFIEKHKSWNWKNNIGGFSGNPNLTMDFLGKHSHWDWDKYRLSGNSSLTQKFIENHWKFGWIFCVLSSNPVITKDFVIKHIYRSWDMQGLSMNPSFTPEIIESLNWDWDWDYILKNPSITLKFVEKNRKKFNINKLSKLNILTENFIKKYKYEWNYFHICKNKNLSLDFLDNLNCCPLYLSQSPNLTPEFVIENIDRRGWNFYVMTFETRCKEEENRIKNRFWFLAEGKDKDSRIQNFKNNYLFDSYLVRFIFSF